MVTYGLDGLQILQQLFISTSGLLVDLPSMLQSLSIRALASSVRPQGLEGWLLNTHIIVLLVTVFLILFLTKEKMQGSALYFHNRVEASKGNNRNGLRIVPTALIS